MTKGILVLPPTNKDWLMSRSEYILDYNFSSEVSDPGDAMDQLQSGVGLNLQNELYRKLNKKINT